MRRASKQGASRLLFSTQVFPLSCLPLSLCQKQVAVPKARKLLLFLIWTLSTHFIHCATSLSLRAHRQGEICIHVSIHLNTINIMHVLIMPQSFIIPFYKLSLLQSPAYSLPRQSHDFLLSLYICGHFLEIYINKIISYILFYVCLFPFSITVLRCILVVACINM